MHARPRNRVAAWAVALTAAIGVVVPAAASIASAAEAAAEPPAPPPTTRRATVYAGGIAYAIYEPGWLESSATSSAKLDQAAGELCTAAERTAWEQLDGKIQLVRDRNPGKVITVERRWISIPGQLRVHDGVWGGFKDMGQLSTWRHLRQPKWYAECAYDAGADLLISDPPILVPAPLRIAPPPA